MNGKNESKQKAGVSLAVQNTFQSKIKYFAKNAAKNKTHWQKQVTIAEKTNYQSKLF